jgi:hypothetical protein
MIPLRPSLSLAFAAALVAGCGEKKITITEPPMSWPPLSEFTAVTNRPATQADVAEGSAVFVLQDQGQPIGEPIDIVLPQYALHVDQEANTKTPCVLIQAEQARGQMVAGARILPDRSIMAGLYGEFELLGSTPPE